MDDTSEYEEESMFGESNEDREYILQKEAQIYKEEVEKNNKYEKQIDEYRKLFEGAREYDITREWNRILKTGSETERLAFMYILEERKYDEVNRPEYRKQRDKMDDKFSFYPSYFEDDFNKRIASKKEFRDYRMFSLAGVKKYEYMQIKQAIASSEICNTLGEDMGLLPQQKFLRNYLSSNTPYRGLLIYHGTGVGKTCTAITIAHEYLKMRENDGKKVIILAPNQVQSNFKREIFNTDKLEIRNSMATTSKPLCNAQKLLLNIAQHKRDCTQNGNCLISTRNAIQDYMRQNFRIIGYNVFVREANNKERQFKREMTNEDDIKNKFNNWIRKTYDNSLIIIDEAHNIRTLDESNPDEKGVRLGQKLTAAYIERIITTARGVRLVLLTATPMYNTATEIIYLLNLLLKNDRRPPIPKNQVFETADGKLTPQGIKIIEQKSRGYISYLRGENPISFPFKLYPTWDANYMPPEKYPDYDMNGNPVDKKDVFLKLCGVPISTKQAEMMNKKILEYVQISGTNFQNINTTRLNTFLNIIDMVFPSITGRDLTGTQGLRASMQTNVKKYLEDGREIEKQSYSYKQDILASFGTFYDLSRLPQFSTKIAEIVKRITESDGVMFAYSRYIEGGGLNIALALEQNGFRRYGDDQLLDLPDWNHPTARWKKGEPICAVCRQKQSTHFVGEKGDKSTGHRFIQAQYVYIPANQRIITASDTEKVKATVVSEENRDGHVIKVIIGSPATSEGIDFKYIRAIHILEPWFNLKKIEQIEGRGIRFCSHAALPFPKRNCSIYLWAGLWPEDNKKNGWETPDVFIYRRAQEKSARIGEISEILKKGAVDYYMNRRGNIISDTFAFTIKTCTDIMLKHTIRDEPYSSVCDYKPTCTTIDEHDVESVLGEDPDEDTYEDYMRDYATEEVLPFFEKMFKESKIYTIDDIMTTLKGNYAYLSDRDVLYIIHKYMKKKVYDDSGREGRIILRGEYFLFQPWSISDEAIPMYYREAVPVNKKPGFEITGELDSSARDPDETRVLMDDKFDEYDRKLSEFAANPGANWIAALDGLPAEYKKSVGNIWPEIFVDYLQADARFDILNYVVTHYDRIPSRWKHAVEPYIIRANNIGKTGDAVVGFRHVLDRGQHYWVADTKGIRIVEPAERQAIIRWNNDHRTSKRGKIYGFSAVKSNHTTVMKFIDNFRKGKKEATGAICTQDNSISRINSRINYLLTGEYIDTGNRQNVNILCAKTEIVMRLKDKKGDDGFRWFFRVPEIYAATV